MKYETKPVIIEAVQYRDGESLDDLVMFMGKEDAIKYVDMNLFPRISIKDKLHQNKPIPVNFGDYIIRGTKGEYYPCNEEVFYEKYQKIVD